MNYQDSTQREFPLLPLDFHLYVSSIWLFLSHSFNIKTIIIKIVLLVSYVRHFSELSTLRGFGKTCICSWLHRLGALLVAGV